MVRSSGMAVAAASIGNIMTKLPAVICFSLLAIASIAMAQRTAEKGEQQPKPAVSLDQFYRTHVIRRNLDVLDIKDEINDLTVKSVKEEFSKTPKITMVHFDSPGGSLDAGIALGRILREQRATVGVDLNAQCASSYVFALVGGTARFVFSAKMGIH
jgi:ATP-dependent protease ClpP protease subunit